MVLFDDGAEPNEHRTGHDQATGRQHHLPEAAINSAGHLIKHVTHAIERQEKPE